MKKIVILFILILFLFGCSKQKHDDLNNTIEVEEAKFVLNNHYVTDIPNSKEGYYFTDNKFIYYNGNRTGPKSITLLARGTWSIENDTLIINYEETLEGYKNDKNEYDFFPKKSKRKNRFKILEVKDKSIKYERKELYDNSDNMTEELKNVLLEYIDTFENFDYKKISSL